MSKTDQTSDNPQIGNSSLGGVSHSTNIQRDFSKKWNELTINEKIDFAGEKNYEDSHTAEFWWDYYHHKYCG